MQRRVPPGCLGPSSPAAGYSLPIAPLPPEGGGRQPPGSQPSGRGSAARFRGPAHGRVQPTIVPRGSLPWMEGLQGSVRSGGGPRPSGLSPPPGGLLSWPQTHSLDTRAGWAVCRSGRAALCGPARPWTVAVLGDGPSSPSPQGEALPGLPNRDRRCQGGWVTVWCWTSPGCHLQLRQCRHKDPAAEGPFAAPALVTRLRGAGSEDSGAVSGGVPGPRSPASESGPPSGSRGAGGGPASVQGPCMQGLGPGQLLPPPAASPAG